MKRLLLTAATLAISAASLAQVPASVPTSVLPGRAEKQFQERVPLPKVAPEAKVESEKATKTSPQLEKIKFKLARIDFEGNTVFSDAELQAMVQNKVGAVISVADLQRMTQEITHAYRKKGYILSKAILPPQRIKGGVVKIRVIEGYISHVSIEGNPQKVKPLLLCYGRRIAMHRPLNVKDLERYALLANDLPGLTVRAVLKPSKTDIGAADLVWVVTQQRFAAKFNYNNRGTRFLGPIQNEMYLTSNSIFRGGDSTTLNGVVTSDANELQYFNITHSTPLGFNGTRLIVEANSTLSRPGSRSLAALDIVGTSETGTITVMHPFVRSRRKNFSMDLAFKYQNNQSDILDTLLFEDRIRALTLGGTYEFTGAGSSTNLIRLSATQGIPVLNPTRTGEPNLSRSDARGDFTKLNVVATRTQWLSRRLSFFLSGAGQWGLTPLYSAEEFGVGGRNYGSAYDPSEIIGDSGVAGKVELRFSFFPNKRFFKAVQLYGTYDGGVTWNFFNPNQENRSSLISTGIGTRVQLNKHFYGSVEYDKPLTREVSALQPDGEGENWRLFFDLTATL